MDFSLPPGVSEEAVFRQYDSAPARGTRVPDAAPSTFAPPQEEDMPPWAPCTLR